jgi:arylformamidase
MNNNIIDLSFGIHDGMITYPTSSHHKFESSIVGRIAIEGRETRKFTMGSHCGTHVDAPRHFFADGRTIDDFDVNDLVGEALLINLGELQPDQLILARDLAPYVPIIKEQKITRILFRTDWSKFWSTRQYYKDWPYFEEKAIDLILSLNIKLLGIDFPSPDSAYFGDDCSLDSPNHKKLFQSNVILVEYLTNLHRLNSGMVYLMVMPLKLLGFDGAPSRVTAYNL